MRDRVLLRVLIVVVSLVLTADAATADSFGPPQQGVAEPTGVPGHRLAVAKKEREDNERIHRVLRGEADFAGGETSIEEFAAAIEKRFQIPVVVRTRKLEEDGISPEEEFTEKAVLEPVGRHIRRHLRDDIGDVTFVVREGTLFITTITDADSDVATELYEVTDLVDRLTDEELAAYREAMATNEEVENQFTIWKTGGYHITSESWTGSGALCLKQQEENRVAAVERWTKSPFPLPEVVPTRVPSLGDLYDASGLMEQIDSTNTYDENRDLRLVVVKDRVFLSVKANDESHMKVVESIRLLRSAIAPPVSPSGPRFF